MEKKSLIQPSLSFEEFIKLIYAFKMGLFNFIVKEQGVNMNVEASGLTKETILVEGLQINQLQLLTILNGIEQACGKHLEFVLHEKQDLTLGFLYSEAYEK